MSNMPVAPVLYAVPAMKLGANDVALFFFEFRNECERIGRYRPNTVIPNWMLDGCNAAVADVKVRSSDVNRGDSGATLRPPSFFLQHVSELVLDQYFSGLDEVLESIQLP